MNANSVSATQTFGSAPPKRTGVDQLGKMDFLQILVTQLRYQDPLKPMDDREFVSQLAQFSALDAVTEQTKWAKMTYGLGLVGQNVKYHTDKGSVDSAVVKAIRLVDGKPMLSLGELEITLDQVVEATRP